jgi:hypothetical protein
MLSTRWVMNSSNSTQSTNRMPWISREFSGKVLFSQATNNTNLSASIECKECRTRGGLDINAHFEVFKGFQGFVEVRPSNLGADAVFDISILFFYEARTCWRHVC